MKTKVPTRNFATSRGIFTYDLYKLFTEIKNRSIIWRIKGRPRKAVNTAWNEVSCEMVPYFKELKKDEQAKIVNYFKTTWRSCLDVMIRSYRQRKQGNRNIPIYRHARQFEFWLELRGLKLTDIATAKELHELDNEQNNSKTKTVPPRSKRFKPDSSNTASTLEIIPSSPNILNENTFDSIKIIETNNKSDDDYLNSIDDFQDEPIHKSPQHQQTNESVQSVQIAVQRKNDEADQSFFDSLKPTLRKLNESQKLDFKIQILKILRKFQ